MNRDPAHYLKPIITTNTPRRLLWLDCATRPSKEQGLMVQRWAGGTLGTTHWTSRKYDRKDTTKWYDDVTQLWTAVDKFCTSNRRTVLFGYDLATQLRVSAALLQLPTLGWQLQNIVLERQSAWARFTQDKRSLMCCDLRAWCPVEFGTIAADIDTIDHKARLIRAGATFLRDKHAWRAHVIREAVLQIFDWVEAESLGPFRPTGSGQSYVAYRRRFMQHKLLVHDDTDRLLAERKAMHTGRCEAWQHGKLTGGPFVEYDMHAAYCTIARDCEVPIVAGQAIHKPTVRSVERAIATHAVLANVTVTTDVPCVPTRMGGRTLWPIGTFTTWLWDPELALVFDYASKVEVTHAYKYTRAPALQSFAAWVLDNMGSQTVIYGRVPQRVMKHWSRCLVGRLGLRYRSWQKFGYNPEPDLRLVTYIDVDDNTSTDLLLAGGDMFMLTDMTESIDSLPQIPSWVMSECRARVWRAMVKIGLDNTVYVDTDSLIARTSDGFTRVGVGDHFRNHGWVRKGTYRSLTINGPRNLTTESDRRIAGLPLTAKQVAPLEFTGEVMRSVKESMRAGQLDCVASIPRKFVMNAADLRRRHLPYGATAPYTVELPPQQED